MSLYGIVYGFSSKRSPNQSCRTRQQNKRLKRINRFAVLGAQDGDMLILERGKALQLQAPILSY